MRFISNAKHGEPIESGTIFEAKAGRLKYRGIKQPFGQRKYITRNY